VAFVTDVSERRMIERLRNTQFAVTRPLASAATWAEAAPQVLQGICGSLGWSLGEIWAVDRESNVLRWEYGWHKAGRDLEAFEAVSREVTFARGVGLLGRVWATGRPSSIHDVAIDGESPRTSTAARAGLRGKFAFAITNGRKVTGVIALFSSHSQVPDRATLRVMADVGSQIGQFIERRRAEDEVRKSGVYRVVKEAMGSTLAKCSVSALMFDYVLTGPISVSKRRRALRVVTGSIGRKQKRIGPSTGMETEITVCSFGNGSISR